MTSSYSIASVDAKIANEVKRDMGGGFAVAACFGSPLQRLDITILPSYWNYDETTGNCTGVTDRGALFTFEEFIDHPRQSQTPKCSDIVEMDDAKKQTQHFNETSELADISSEITGDTFNFHTDNEDQNSRLVKTFELDYQFSVEEKHKQQNENEQQSSRLNRKQQQKARRANSTPKSTNSKQFKLFTRSSKQNSTYEAEESPGTKNEISAISRSASQTGVKRSAILRRTFCPTIRNNAYSIRTSFDDDMPEYVRCKKENIDEKPSSSTIAGASNSTFSFQRAFSNLEFDALNNNTNVIDQAVSAEGAQRNTQEASAAVAETSRKNSMRWKCDDSIVGYLFSKLACCFRATVGVVDIQRNRHYVINNRGENQLNFTAENVNNNNSRLSNNNKSDNHKSTSSHDVKYSWDRVNENTDDDDDYRILNASDELIIRMPGQIKNHQQFIIENCENSIIVILDSSASVTIDDCSNCLIVLGPCRGSVFLRDNKNCALFAICQQFRARDCHHIAARLFCATAPTIEDSSVEFGALTICYNKIEEQIAEAGLSPLTNNWFRVHNFTPDTTRFTLVESREFLSDVEDEENLTPNFHLNERFFTEFISSPEVNTLNLTFRPRVSFFFHVNSNDEQGEGPSTGEEKALILVKSFDKRVNLKTDQELYHDVRRLLKRLFTTDGSLAVSSGNLESPKTRSRVRLVGLHDVKLKPGEIENVLLLKPIKSPGGRLVAIELKGDIGWLRGFCTQILASLGSPSTMKLVDSNDTDFTVQQLSRFSEIQKRV